MTETKHKEHITSKHFGIPADFADRAENYAAWRVQALMAQLAEAQALIEASRKQEPVATVEMHPDGRRRTIFKDSVTDCDASWKEKQKLYAAPVVAPDVLKDADRYRWLREQSWMDNLCVVDSPKNSLKLGSFCPSQELLDSLIDAAMGGTND